MHLNPICGSLAVALSVVFLPPAWADARLTYTDTGLGAPVPTRTTSIQIQGDKVRMEEAGSGIYSLYDHSKQTLHTVNTHARQYLESSLDKVRQRMEKMLVIQTRMQTQLRQQMALLPPEQRQQAEAQMQQAEAMKKAPAPVASQQNTGKTEQIQGIPCNITNVLMNGAPVRELCNATQPVLDEADYQRLLGMFTYMDSMVTVAAQTQGITPPPADAGSASIHKQGVALRVQALPTGPRSELTAISKDKLEASLFELPVGFALYEPSDAPNPPPTQPTPQ